MRRWSWFKLKDSESEPALYIWLWFGWAEDGMVVAIENIPESEDFVLEKGLAYNREKK